MTAYLRLLARSSHYFLELAKEHHNDVTIQRYYLVSAFIDSWTLLEAYVNHASDILSEAGKIDQYSRAVLQHKGLSINEHGVIVENTSHLPTMKRIMFIINNFSTINAKTFRKTKLWTDVGNAEEFRNQLIHPRQFKIERLTLKKAEETRKCIIELIKKMNQGVFHKPITFL